MLYYSYHRTSTTDQKLDRGVNEINKFINDKGIKLNAEIYTDQCTGKNFNRPSYKELKKQLLHQVNKNKEQVTLIVTELDRLGRDKTLTLKEIREYQNLGIRLMVLEIPTTLTDVSSMEDDKMANMMMETINNMLIEMYASFAHAEMEKRSKRQTEGIQAKKDRGEWADYGRPRALAFDKFTIYYKRVLKGELKPKEVMELLDISKQCYYRYRKEYESNQEHEEKETQKKNCKLTNKEIIEKKVKELDYKLGCYNNMIDKLSKKELKKVIEDLDQERTDVKVKINRKPYVVEITTMDNDKDLSILSVEEYVDRYGDEILEEE